MRTRCLSGRSLGRWGKKEFPQMRGSRLAENPDPRRGCTKGALEGAGWPGLRRNSGSARQDFGRKAGERGRRERRSTALRPRAQKIPGRQDCAGLWMNSGGWGWIQEGNRTRANARISPCPASWVHLRVHQTRSGIASQRIPKNNRLLSLAELSQITLQVHPVGPMNRVATGPAGYGAGCMRSESHNVHHRPTRPADIAECAGRQHRLPTTPSKANQPDFHDPLTRRARQQADNAIDRR